MNYSTDPLVRPYRDGDEDQLVDLFLAAYGHPITRDHWRWKLRGAGSLANVWLAQIEDRIVFQYAGIPLRIQLAGVPATAMVAVDAMTAPEFRRRGLLTTVVQRAHSNWRDQGIAFVLGLPNEHWGSRTRALGWQRLFPLQWLFQPLRPEGLIAYRLKAPWAGKVTAFGSLWNRWLRTRFRPDSRLRMENVAIAGDEFDHLWRRGRSESLVTPVRDRQWVDWRFFASPMHTYQVVLAQDDKGPAGYCVYRIKRASLTLLHVAEIVTAHDHPQVRDSLLSHIIEQASNAGAHGVVALAVTGSDHFRWLRHACFMRGPAFMVHLVPLDRQLPAEALRDVRHWNLTGAEFDVV
ncbi:MAG TPA: GNAT family N-acetyltransferase [Steroidobacter sp.]|nr:GNAT family N-acetyltransferase [Steroidobacter sp.]